MYSLPKMRKNTTVAGSLLHLENAAKWLCQSKMQVDRLDQINTKLNAKLISTFGFSTL